MNSAIQTCMRHPEWEYSVDFPVQNPHDISVPSGIFCSIQGNRYHPSITCTDHCFYNDYMRLGLVTEAGPVTGPKALIVAGTGSVIVTNTGPTPLAVGQSFTVEYPSEATRRTQSEASKMSHTKNSHTKMQHSESLWGHFPATVSHPSTSKGLIFEHRFEKEIMESKSLGVIMSMGKLMTLCRDAAGTEITPVTYYADVSNQTVHNKDVVLANLKNQTHFLKRLLRASAEVVDHYKPRVTGIVQHAVLGNADSIAVGAQCYAIVTFK